LTQNNIFIRKITWENVRNFESLELPSGSGKFSNSTSLAQIQNGYGKTTTLYLLRSVFSNMPIDKNFIKSGYRYRFPHKKWGGDQNSPSKFYVEFEVNDEFCRIGLEIDHINMKQKFTTFRESLGGEIDGWQPPNIFRRLFEGKDDFVKLFVMDGELAKELNSSTGSAAVNAAIKQVTNLAGLHLLVGSELTNGQIHRVKQEQLSSIIGDGEERGVRLQSALSKVEELKQEQRMRLQQAKDHVSRVSAEIIECNIRKNKLDKKISQTNKELEKAKTRLERSSTDLEKTATSILERLFQPAFSYPEWQEVQEFHASQVKAKLPRSVGRTWFKEVLELETCICGRSWDEHSKEYVGEHLEDFLDTRLMTYVKEMQDSVAEHSNSQSYGSELERLKQKQIERVLNSQSVDDIRSQASDEDRKAYSELDQKIGTLTTELTQWEHLRDVIGSEKLEFIKEWGLHQFVYNTDTTVTNNIAKIKEIENLKGLEIVESDIARKIAEIGGAAEIAKGAELVQNVISEMLTRVEKEINIELEGKMNSSISRMVGAGQDGGLVVKITDQGLQYYNPNGDLQSGVNMAAELGGSYAFISALYQYAEVSIPLVLDTPLAGFGDGASADWTKLVPPTFNQVIALINSSEMRALKGWFEKGNADVYLIRRADEVIPLGKPQTGKMIVDSNVDNFVTYERDVLKGDEE